MSLKRTSLYEEHVRLGGRMVDFGGWELPVQYSKGIGAEHLACRAKAGLFDVSHMGEFLVEGPEALSFLQHLVPNDVSKIVEGQALYTVLCRENGTAVDDLLIYRRSGGRYLVVVNASNTEKDWKHFESELARFQERSEVRMRNASAEFAQIAIQGRVSPSIVQAITDLLVKDIKTYHFQEGTVLGSIPAIIARTGYTGEDGYELYLPWSEAPKIWRALLEAGAPLGLEPCGLGARDTLRLEARLPLYGHELTDEVNPLEAGLGWTVKLEKADFIGKQALSLVKTEGVKKKLVGLKLLDRGIPRQGFPVFESADAGSAIGAVTSGTFSPSLQAGIALAFVPPQLAALGTKLYLDIRGQKVAAEVAPTPFYKKPYTPEGITP